MITDIFQQRYPSFFYFPDRVPSHVHVFLRQCVFIIFDDLNSVIPDMQTLCSVAYTKLVREIGYSIYDGDNAKEICIGALSEQYDLWNNRHATPEVFALARFSLLELLFSGIEKALDPPNNSPRFNVFGVRKARRRDMTLENRKEAFRAAEDELNTRLRQAGIPLQYYNGLFQYSSDQVTAAQIEEPFWKLLKNPNGPMLMLI